MKLKMSDMSPEQWEAAIQMCVNDTGEDEAFVRAHLKFCAYAEVAVVAAMRGYRPPPKP